MAFKLLGNLFSRKKGVEDINADELRKERIGLENEERRLEKNINRLRQDDQQIKSEYAAAHAKGDDHQKRMLARKIQDVRSQLNAFDKRHSTLIKQMRMINGLVLIKDNTEFIKRISSNSKISSMDLVEIQQFVEQATLEGELTEDRLENLVKAMDESNGTYADSEKDGGLGDIMAELDSELELNDATLGEINDSELDLAMKALDKEVSAQKDKAQSQAKQKEI